MLDEVMRLFWRRGYAVSMEEIVQATGLNRYAIYQRWGGKDDLYKQALLRYRDMFLETAMAPLIDGSAGLDDIRAVFDASLAMFDTDEAAWGCMMCRTLTEPVVDVPEIAQVVEAHFAKIGTLFQRALERARDRGEIARDADTRALADFLVGIVQGAQLFGRRRTDRDTVANYFDGAVAALR